MYKLPILFIAIFLHYRYAYSPSKRRHTYQDASSVIKLSINYNLTIQEWICANQLIMYLGLCDNKIYYLLSSLISILVDIPDTIYDVFKNLYSIFGGTEPRLTPLFSESTECGMTVGINTCLDPKTLRFRTDVATFQIKSNWDVQPNTCDYQQRKMILRNVGSETPSVKYLCDRITPLSTLSDLVASEILVSRIPTGKHKKCAEQPVNIEGSQFEDMNTDIGSCTVPPPQPLAVDETPSTAYKNQLKSIRRKSEAVRPKPQAVGCDVGTNTECVREMSDASTQLTTSHLKLESEKCRLFNVLPFKSAKKFVPSRQRRRRPATRTYRKLQQLNQNVSALSSVVHHLLKRLASG